MSIGEGVLRQASPIEVAMEMGGESPSNDQGQDREQFTALYDRSAT